MERLNPSSTVLLVVDVQEKLAAAMPEEALERLVKNTGILLETARVLGMRVLASEQYPKGLGPTLPPIAEKLAALEVTPLPKLTFDACSDLFFQDHDVLWLYDSKYSEVPDAADGKEPSPVPPVLQPDNWFEDFLNVPPRSPERGHIR